MSASYPTIKRLYEVGNSQGVKLSLSGLDNAVIKGWITETEKQQILGV